MATTPSSSCEPDGEADIDRHARDPRVERLKAALAAYAPRRTASGSLKRAAVLVPIVLAPEPELLFIVRPTSLASHSGQVAFPGGRIDPEDRDATHAALREAEEELGVARTRPEVVGALDDLPTHTGFHVAPIVALLEEPLALAPSPHEVASVFRVPLVRLSDPREQRTLRGHRRPHATAGRTETRLTFWVNTPAPIWGVTGQILVNLLSVLAAHDRGA